MSWMKMENLQGKQQHFRGACLGWLSEALLFVFVSVFVFLQLQKCSSRHGWFGNDGRNSSIGNGDV